MLKEIMTISDNIHGYRWNIEEDEETLLSFCPPLTLEENQCEWTSFKSERRRKEFLASRCIVNKIFGDKERIIYDTSGAPHLLINKNYHISISHSHHTVLLTVGSIPHGVDIERYSTIPKKCAKHFLQEKENATIAHKNDIFYTIFWTAKEATYKASSSQKEYLNSLMDIYVDLDRDGNIYTYTPKHQYKTKIDFVSDIQLAICTAFPADLKL